MKEGLTVATADYNVIHTWIRYWKKDLLDKPKELVLGSEYLVNVLPQAIEPLEDWQKRNAGTKLQKNSKNWERKLAALLERAVAEDPVADLIAAEHPTEIKQLRQFLSAGAYDVSLITPILRMVRDAPSSETLKETLVQELAKGEDADRQLLGAVAMVMARRGIGNFTDRQLRDFLERALAREGTFALIEEHLDEMKAHEGLEERVLIVARELFANAARSLELSGVLDSEMGEFFDLFGDDSNWGHLAYRLLDQLRELWTSALETYNSGEGETVNAAGAASALLQEDEALKELGTKFICHYAAAVFRRAMQIADPDTINEPEAHVAEAGHALAAFLGEKGVFHDPEIPGQYEGAMYGTAYRAMRVTATSIQIETSEALAEDYIARDADFVTDLACEVGRRMTEMLAEEAGANRIEAVAPTVGDGPEDLETVCFNWAARRTVHAELGRLLAPLGPRLLKHIEGAANSPGEMGLPLGEEFWDLFARYFSRETRKPTYVSWYNIDEGRLRLVVDRLFYQLEGREGEYLAIFRVGNLNPRNLGWRMGGVTFYDPATFDYGEGRWFREDTASGGSFVHAAVRILAHSEVEARRRARRLLEEALSCLSFALSVHMKLSGYKPEVFSEAFILDLTDTGFLYGGVPRLEYGHAVHSADNSDIPRKARAYDHLLSLSARGESLNELQEVFLKAVRWYREARWEQDPAQRFTLYWISLEHIFVRGQTSKQRGIYEDLPALQMTWRNLGRALMPLSWSLQSVRKKIEDDEELETLVNGSPQLENWRSDERVLLDPKEVKALIDLTPQDRSEARKVFQDYLKQLEELALYSDDIREDVAHRRDRQ